jgi:predicted SAM-dependent methyltransferase
LRGLGVDLNGNMIELCHSLGLECVRDDAIGYLSKLPDNSLGAITGFHIIEHLTFKTFVALLDESKRALKPGGLVLFETPNPANVLVGSRWFYLDPTHRNPMPAEMTAMIAEDRGFVQVQIHELHPMVERFQARDELLAAQLDRLFHGPQDYALIGRKA